MKIEVSDLKKSKYLIKISLPPEELVSYFRSTYEKLALGVKISGFRPGKAPQKLTEEAIGQAKLLSESLNLAIQESYFEAVKKEKLIPISSPKIVIIKYPKWGLTPDEIQEELIFEAEIEVMPKVKLKDYSKIRVKKKKVTEVRDNDIEKILTHLRRQKASFSDVDRGAQKGDRAEISYEGFIDNVKVDAMSAKNQPIILGDETLIPGFEEQIVDLKKGEKKEFEISFPKDYRAKGVAGPKPKAPLRGGAPFGGKAAKFKVKLVDLKKIDLPELDDKFAQNFGQSTAKDLRIAIEKSLKEEITAKAKNELELEVIDKVLPKLEVEIPDGLLEQEIDRIIAGMEERVKSRGLSLEKYLESIKKTLPDLRRDLRTVAEKNVRIGFLLGKIIEQEKLDPKDSKAGKRALEILISAVTK